MLVLKYFVVVGGLMVAGLMALNAHMAPSGSVCGRRGDACLERRFACHRPAQAGGPWSQPAAEAASGGGGREACQGRGVIPAVPRRPNDGRVDRRRLRSASRPLAVI